ncbi:MAG: hypothetical protein K6F69_08395 [Treponema sp.]|nr:hypothetical protein [Treponema sp.]
MCWKCGKPITLEYVGRTDICPFCGADLHSCKNCNFYSPSSHYECHETIEECVRDKERANFCDNFVVNKNISSSDNNKAKDARSAFNSLFGD